MLKSKIRPFFHSLSLQKTWKEKMWCISLALRLVFPDPIYFWKLRKKRRLCEQPQRATTQKRGRYLFAAPIGAREKTDFKKLLLRFGHENFDYRIFIYDDTKFEEPLYKRCTFIREPRHKWYYGKHYLTPDQCAKYEYIFFWDGDIDIAEFSYRNFLDIMHRNNLEVAQPSLTPGSYYTHPFTLKNKRYKVGRYFDFIEIMVPVFTFNAWARFWSMIEPDFNYWGYGYDDLAKSFCGYNAMAIIDQESVTHTQHSRSDAQAPRLKEMRLFLLKHPNHKIAKRICYGPLLQ